MNERFDRFFYLTSNLYTEGSPVIIESGALLKDKETRAIIGQVKLKSITNKVIKFARIKINYFDSLGRPVGESQSFEYLDLAVSRDESFGAKKPIRIPDSTSRSFAVTVTEVGFVDNSFWSNTDGVWEPLPEQERFFSRYPSDDNAKSYKSLFGKAACYIVLEEKDLWYCSCGKINRKGEEHCHHCNVALDALLNVDLDVTIQAVSNEMIYKHAIKLMQSACTLADYKAAISEFSKIPEYLDSANMIKLCDEKIKEILSAKAKLRNDEEKRKKAFTVKVIIIAVAIVASMLIFSLVISPWIGYSTGDFKVPISTYNIKEFVIPDGVTKISDEAFFGCTELESVVIPDSVTSIGEDAFAWCDSLTSIVIPDSVTTIGDGAFSYCDSLTSVTIGSGVISIGDSAFYGCDNLTSVVIGDSVTSIGHHAFTYCDSLTSIKYRGTETQWEAITKPYLWDYGSGNYTITYNYTGK